MPATITRNVAAPTFDNTNVSYVKGLMTAMGLPTSAIVYETTTEAIYKITRGTGTYADSYIRWFSSISPLGGANLWTYQIGTGLASNALTGAGSTVGYLHYQSGAFVPQYYSTIVTADNTYRSILFFNSAYTYLHSFHIVQPTNTSLTANNCPLTNFYSPTSSGATLTTNVPTVSIQNLAVASSQYGATISQPALNGVTGNYPVGTAKSGSYGVAPNVPLLSGGWPIGYNTNLGTTAQSLLPMDRIIVTAGSEEWVVCDRLQGLCVREVG